MLSSESVCFGAPLWNLHFSDERACKFISSLKHNNKPFTHHSSGFILGTFVTVGNGTQPFQRLFHSLAEIIAQLPQPIVVQAGHNAVDLPGCIVFDFVGQEQFEQLIDDHELIISHAGVGSILTALERGRRPVVIPRRCGAYAEIINDHQITLVTELADLGLVSPVLATERLPEAILDAVQAQSCQRTSSSSLEFAQSLYLDKFNAALNKLSARRRGFRKLCLVSACGGHLTELRKLKPVYEKHSFFYVINNPIVQPSDMQGKTYTITLCERDWRAGINFWEAFRILLRERPDCIVSTGAWPAIPFAIVGRILGIPNIYIETMARVTLPSLTGRFMYYLADRFFYPWRQLSHFFPKGHYCGLLV
jgi:UDP-N-acetylglucosamine transferase subunit ALG13